MLIALAIPAARALIAHWHRLRERRATARATHLALGALDDHLLRDLGIDRSDISSIATAAAGRGDLSRAVTTALR